MYSINQKDRELFRILAGQTVCSRCCQPLVCMVGDAQGALLAKLKAYIVKSST